MLVIWLLSLWEPLTSCFCLLFFVLCCVGHCIDRGVDPLRVDIVPADHAHGFEALDETDRVRAAWRELSRGGAVEVIGRLREPHDDLHRLLRIPIPTH